MVKFTGKGVAGAMCISKASLFNKSPYKVIKRKITDTGYELSRLSTAKTEAKNQLIEIYNKALTEVGEMGAQIFDIHIMMLDDEDYNESIESIIKNQKANAEYAVYLTSINFQDMFASMSDGYMRARASDIKDVSERIISCLEGKELTAHFGGDNINICAIRRY